MFVCGTILIDRYYINIGGTTMTTVTERMYEEEKIRLSRKSYDKLVELLLHYNSNQLYCERKLQESRTATDQAWYKTCIADYKKMQQITNEVLQACK